MEVEQSRTDYPAMTFDEVSMERSKSFVKALQELKNLRPQLYSTAEYIEKSYLHSEQKQMVLNNLKDYAVQALVNAVDHLGTVAYKLTDLLEKQMLDSSTMELKISCLNQKLLTCQTYTRQEGLRQQQLLAIIPRHHKHYILPNSVCKKVHFSPLVQTDPRQHHFQAISHFQQSGSPASNTLSWHMASETKSTTLKGTSEALTSNEEPKSYGKTSGVFNLLDNEVNTWTKSSVATTLLASGDPAVMQTFGVTHRDQLERTKPLTAFRSFDNPRREMVRAPVRSRSILSAFFVKQKPSKLKPTYVS